MLVKEDNLPRMSWRKRRIFNVISGVDKHIRAAEIKICQFNSDKMLNLKRTLKYLAPFEVMDADKCGTENNVDIPPAEITPTRRIRRTAAMNADLLRRLNDIDDDIDKRAW